MKKLIITLTISLPLFAQYTTDTALTSYTSSAASTNSTSVKTTGANVYSISGFNTNTTIYYLRLYNSTSAPTCSSATGFIETIPVPPASAAGGAGGFVRAWSWPQGFSSGLGFCITGGSSSTDNTNAATGVFITILYK